MEREIDILKSGDSILGKSDTQEFQAYKSHMDLRLEETMAEAKRHYKSYQDIRE